MKQRTYNNPNFGPKVDTYRRAATDTFVDIIQYSLNQGYAQMREARLQIAMIHHTLEQSLPAKVFLLPNCSTLDPEGQPRKYLAIVRCENDLLAREVYNVGTKGTFS